MKKVAKVDRREQAIQSYRALAGTVGSGNEPSKAFHDG
jgi:hypothetical protein